MKSLIPILALLAMTACGPNGEWTGGNPLTDCAAAKQATNAASLANVAAQGLAAANPKVDALQKLAAATQVALTTAQANQANVCPPPA